MALSLLWALSMYLIMSNAFKVLKWVAVQLGYMRRSHMAAGVVVQVSEEGEEGEEVGSEEAVQASTAKAGIQAAKDSAGQASTAKAGSSTAQNTAAASTASAATAAGTGSSSGGASSSDAAAAENSSVADAKEASAMSDEQKEYLRALQVGLQILDACMAKLPAK